MVCTSKDTAAEHLEQELAQVQLCTREVSITMPNH